MQVPSMMMINDPSLTSPQHLLQLSIKEITSDTKKLLKKHGYGHTQGGSWKFPHLTIDQLDLKSLFDQYQSREPEVEYKELLELLVDRMVFSIHTLRLILRRPSLGSLEEEVGGGDAGRYVLQDMDNLEPSSTTTDVQNVPQLLSEFQDLILGMVRKNKNGEIRSSRIPVSLSARTLRNRPEKLPLLISSRTSSRENAGPVPSSPTDEVMSSGPCETCFIALNMLKLLSSGVAQCLTNLGAEPEVATLKHQIWSLSQREFLLAYVSSLQSDWRKLTTLANTLQDDKVDLTSTLEEYKSGLEEQVKQQVVLAKDFHNRIRASEEGLETERRKVNELAHINQVTSSQLREVRAALGKKSQEASTLDTQVRGQSEAIQRGSFAYRKLKEAHTVLEKERDKAQEELRTLHEDKQKALVQLEEKESQLKKSKSNEQALRALLEKAKTQLLLCKKSEDGWKVEKGRLETLITKQKDHIELLSLYPDLNGPIVKAEMNMSNPIQEMAQQVRSNVARIKTLQEQTERMKRTLTKCGVSIDS